MLVIVAAAASAGVIAVAGKSYITYTVRTIQVLVLLAHYIGHIMVLLLTTVSIEEFTPISS